MEYLVVYRYISVHRHIRMRKGVCVCVCVCVCACVCVCVCGDFLSIVIAINEGTYIGHIYL